MIFQEGEEANMENRPKFFLSQLTLFTAEE
jgi:hypothetical protein